MADIKRVNYFTHQFLVEKDFDDEQDYHIDMRRRHNRVNHSWGVAEGLDVTKTENKKVTISPGTSIDKDGQEIVLLEPLPVDLTAFGSNTDVYLSISYQEVFDEADHYTSGGIDNYTRTTERPKLESSSDAPDPLPGDGSVITLARVHLDGSGNVVEIANSVRTLVGSKVAPGAVSTNELADGAVTEQKLANNAVSNRTIQDNAITHHKIVDGNVRSAELSNNAVSSAKIAEADGRTGQNTNTGAGIKTGHIQNEAVTGAKIAKNTISDTKLDAATRGKLVTNGNNHDHYRGDGAKIRHSTLSKDDGRNPHGTTAADVGALPLRNDIVLDSQGTIQVRSERRFAIIAQCRVDAGSGWYYGSHNAAIAGITLRSDRYGIVAASTKPDTYALYVRGNAHFTGTKGGYVVDTFHNASGQRLRSGDIVKLKGTPVAHFRGDGNKIPVAEVSLADKENDNMAIGIVDREAIPEPDVPDNRVDPDDPTFIEDGGELFVVTLGAYAHCKVDATEAPIEVGDLLTSSSNPGHAKKATDPKIGCIIGKALEPLKEETGYIAVFVNIQ